MGCLGSISSCFGGKHEAEEEAPVALMSIGAPTNFVHVSTMAGRSGFPTAPVPFSPRPPVPITYNTLTEQTTALPVVTSRASVEGLPQATLPETRPGPSPVQYMEDGMRRHLPSGSGLPPAWDKCMDDYLAYLDGSGEVDLKVMASKLRAQFPELGKDAIPSSALNQRLIFLDHQPAGYFTKDMTNDELAADPIKGFRKGLEVAKADIKNKTGQDLDTLEAPILDKSAPRPIPTGSKSGMKASASQSSVTRKPTVLPVMQSSMSQASVHASSVSPTTPGSFRRSAVIGTPTNPPIHGSTTRKAVLRSPTKNPFHGSTSESSLMSSPSKYSLGDKTVTNRKENNPLDEGGPINPRLGYTMKRGQTIAQAMGEE